MKPVPDDLLRPDSAPKSAAATEIERLIAFGSKAGTGGSATNTFLKKMLRDKTTADVFARICIDNYASVSGWIDSSIEGIIFTLTDLSGTLGDVNKDFGAALFKEVAMDIMGGGKLPDVNAAADMNLLNVAKDVTSVVKSLDEFVFFNDVHLSGWSTYFDDFAENLGYVDVDEFGSVTILNQKSYDALRNVFKMRKPSDLQTLNEHIDGMLKEWSKNGKCIVDEGFEPRFAFDANGDICPEGKTYAAISKMRNTAEGVQANIKRFGDVANVIGNIADAVSIYSNTTQKVKEL